MAATAPASETTQEAAAPVPALPPPPTAPVRRGPLAGLTGLEQIAAFLIAVGEEASIAILKNMPEEAVEAIALEIHKMRFVQPDIVDAVLDEVADVFVGVCHGSEVAAALDEINARSSDIWPAEAQR